MGEAMFPGLRVLLVDDEESVRDLFTIRLERWGCEVAVAKGGQEGVERYRHLRPDLVLMDLRMPGGNGIEASRAIVDWDPEASIILITGSPDAFLARKALEEKLVKLVVPKPFHFDQLEMAMREVVKTRKPASQPLPEEDAIA
jgi:CheY-like chemotaxis protein